ncbi:MAG TPA: AzlD domain-containing protein [Candidatus Limiplasma sp.]|nr:AzlD domain-containing protein [Candidatus Limiplasma sp.]HPS81369.1 AzlD domain-containing protein [Candidatus Limiplasma sp.]
MTDTLQTAAIIGVIALMTWVTRGLPYLLFSRKSPPPAVTYLGAALPSAIMVILVVYCLRNTAWTVAPYGAAELISVAVVALMQIWRKNSLLSIFTGTACYMILIRTAFPMA